MRDSQNSGDSLRRIADRLNKPEHKNHHTRLSLARKHDKNPTGAQQMTRDTRREMVQLPIWPEPVRGGPNALLRSAFLVGIASKKRKVRGTQVKVEDEPEGVEIIAEVKVRIKDAGTQLNQ